MVFCGQCGALLSSKDVRCPRCGAVTEPNPGVEDVQTDAPTVASSFPSYPLGEPQPPLDLQHLTSPPSVPGQQKLVLRGNASPANEPAGMMGAEIYAPHTPIPLPPYDLNPAALHSDSSPNQPVAKRRRNGGAMALFITLFVLLILLSTTAVIVLRQMGFFGNNGMPPQPTASQQAQALVQQYYDDINNRDYRSAYNLWGTNPQHPLPTYRQFASGYAHTQHDDITFGTITPHADGTVTLDLTIHATETTLTGIRLSTYQGSYLVGQQNGSWKLLNGDFQQIASMTPG